MAGIEYNTSQIPHVRISACPDFITLLFARQRIRRKAKNKAFPAQEKSSNLSISNSIKEQGGRMRCRETSHLCSFTARWTPPRCCLAGGGAEGDREGSLPLLPSPPSSCPRRQLMAVLCSSGGIFPPDSRLPAVGRLYPHAFPCPLPYLALCNRP